VHMLAQGRAEQMRICVGCSAFFKRPCKWSFSFWLLLYYILLSPHAGTLPQSEWHVSIFADADNRLPGRRKKKKKKKEMSAVNKLSVSIVWKSVCSALSFFLSVLLFTVLRLFNQVQGRLGRDHKKGVLAC